jgi:hypothetical protein
VASLAERIADNGDPLRFLLRAARSWRVPPTVFLGERTVDASGWTRVDTTYALALEDYEAGLCPGGDHVLAETSKPEHEDAWRPNPPTRCHYCTARAVVAKADKAQENTAGLYYSFGLNQEVVELNLQPVPPLPPELAAPGSGGAAPRGDRPTLKPPNTPHEGIPREVDLHTRRRSVARV